MNSKQVYDLAFKGIPITAQTANTKVRAHEYGCYGLYCTKTNKMYVGSSMYCGERKSIHFGDLKRGRHSTMDMQADFDKYGRDAFLFFVIEAGPYESMGETELAWGELLRSKKVLYNQSRRFAVRPDRKEMEILRMSCERSNDAMEKQNLINSAEHPPKSGSGTNASELAERLGIGTDAIRKRWNKKMPGRKFSASSELTEKEIAALSGGTEKAGKSKKETPVYTIASPTPADSEKVSPGKKREPWYVLWVPVLITISSIALTVTGLFVFAQWAGALLGAMFALFLFAAVMIARDNMKGDTSEQALRSVLRLEMGAAALHCFTFWRLLPQFPDGQWFFYARVVACAVLAGFAAYLSYSAVLTVRNYNAETE